MKTETRTINVYANNVNDCVEYNNKAKARRVELENSLFETLNSYGYDLPNDAVLDALMEWCQYEIKKEIKEIK